MVKRKDETSAQQAARARASAEKQETLRKENETNSRDSSDDKKTSTKRETDLPAIELKQEGKGASKTEKFVSVAQRPIKA